VTCLTGDALFLEGVLVEVKFPKACWNATEIPLPGPQGTLSMLVIGLYYRGHLKKQEKSRHEQKLDGDRQVLTTSGISGNSP